MTLCYLCRRPIGDDDGPIYPDGEPMHRECGGRYERAEDVKGDVDFATYHAVLMGDYP